MEKINKESTDKIMTTAINSKTNKKATPKKTATSPVHNTSDGEMPDPSESHGPAEEEVRSAFTKKKK
jgi:hypothetical protein